MQQKARAYQVIRDELYKASVRGPLLYCLSRDDGKELLAQTHSGICGGPIGSRALAAKVFRQGFFWPLIIDDVSKLITTCKVSQKFSPKSKAPSHLIAPLWPLQRWGIDIMGPLTTALGNYKYAIVVVEYFTKLSEASSRHSSSGAQKIFLAKYNMLLRSA
jgi:hypothetical protein